MLPDLARRFDQQELFIVRLALRVDVLVIPINMHLGILQDRVRNRQEIGDRRVEILFGGVFVIAVQDDPTFLVFQHLELHGLTVVPADALVLGHFAEAGDVHVESFDR